MIMRSPEELLEATAVDGTFNSDEWPSVLGFILSQLQKTVHSNFPRPPPLKSRNSTSPKPALTHKPDVTLSQESQTANKENNPPPHAQPRSQPSNAIDAAISQADKDSDFPSEILSLYNSICQILSQSFATSPPHTIQRLAELILRPRQHYRFLPPYLHALNRVLSVSSSVEAFPLPQAVVSTSSSLLNGTGTSSASTPSSSAASTLGSDESLGGALLTPIPWLRPEREQQARSEFKPESTETVDGPNGAGTIETVSVVNGHLSVVVSSAAVRNNGGTNNNANTNSNNNNNDTNNMTPTAQGSTLTSPSLREVGGVTQGELLRQEQEAGIVPVTQSGQRIGGSHAGVGSGHNGLASGSEDDVDDAEASDELDAMESEPVPHARGPENVGMEDMGPQSRPAGAALDLTAAVGRPVSRGEVKMGGVDAEDDEEDYGVENEDEGDNAKGEIEGVKKDNDGEGESKNDEAERESQDDGDRMNVEL